MGQSVACKVSVVNQDGLIVLDTLVRPMVNGQNVENVREIPQFKSLHHIHGIKADWLADAPTFSEVQEHILELCAKYKTENEGNPPIFIGHGVLVDLKAVGISDVPYICT